MATKKCSMCGAFKPLIGGLCAECKALRAYEINERADDVLDSMITDESNANSTTFQDYCSALTKEYARKQEEKNKVPTKEEAYVKVFDDIMKLNKISESDIKKYRPQLNFLVKKYLFHLAQGTYGLMTKDRYVTEHLGNVVDVAGRWVLFQIAFNHDDGIEVELRPEVAELIKTIEARIQEEVQRVEEQNQE